MKAQIIRAFGSPDVFELTTLPDPVPGPGEVLVRVQAASVNPVDYKIRGTGPAFAPELPAVLGCDMAGEVIDVGEGVTGFAPGDLVYGCVGGVRNMPGTYAERVVADARLLAHRPQGLPVREAAAMPLVTITAWEALYDRANVQEGQSVLVHGGAGGVGHIAVQLAKARDAQVFTTVSSPEKAEIARRFGANETINYREERVDAYTERLTQGRGFDVVLDATGGSDIATSFAAARLNGHVVTIVSHYQADLAPMHVKGLTLHVVFMLIPMLHNIGRAHHGELLTQAAELVHKEHLRPLLDPERFTLSELSAAHRHAQSGQAVGKVVIDIAE